MNDPAKVTLISGKAIASTLKTVSTLGEIGKKILDSAGIQEIDLEGWYPSYLRNQISSVPTFFRVERAVEAQIPNVCRCRLV